MMPLLDSLINPLWRDQATRDHALARLDRRSHPGRRLLGTLALGVQHDDQPLVNTMIDRALGWPEQSVLQSYRKACLLFAVTGLLARAGWTTWALQLAPSIPFAPSMAQVLIFSADNPEQSFCWRVTPAYALAQRRPPTHFPVAALVEAYQNGKVVIDQPYLRRVVLPTIHACEPILLLPHPQGLTQIENERYIVLDGNHRVVAAWQKGYTTLRGFVLTPEEGAAVLVRHTQWPPYVRCVIAEPV